MKKLLMIILVVFMLAGCKGKDAIKKPTVSEADGKTYLELVKNYKTREKNPNNTIDSKEFDEFLDKVFKDGMAQDYTGMHFNVIDYKSYGIEKPPVDLGIVTYGVSEEDFNYILDQLKELQSFDYNSLSYRQQYDYEALEYSDYETLADLCYGRYSFLFSMGVDVLNNLVTILSDFTFYDEESVDDYMLLVKDADRYIADCLAYCDAQQKDKIYMPDTAVDNGIETAESLASKVDDNVLIVTFDNRIDDCDFLSSEKKEALKKENAEVVKNEVIPALENCAKKLETYRGKIAQEDTVLYKYNKEYAELQYILNTSDNKGIDRMFEELKDNYDVLLSKLRTALYSPESVKEYFRIAEEGVLEGTAVDKLEYLRTHLGDYYKDLGDIAYTCEPIDESAASDAVGAYYWSAPIDNINQNIIKTNPNSVANSYEFYQTLAHEGFPGHLYQHVYYLQQNPHNFRTVIGFIGYTEGWAVQCQQDAMHFLDIADEKAIDILNLMETYYFMEYSIIDIGMNYYGWTNEEIAEFLKDEQYYAVENYLTYYDEYREAGITLDDVNEYFIQEGFYDEMAQDLFNWIIDMPTVYCNYGVGLSNLMTLKKHAMDSLGDKFDIVEYNCAILENGPLPFSILKEEIEDYIASKK